MTSSQSGGSGLRSFVGQSMPIVSVALVALIASLFILFGQPHASESHHPEAWQLVFNLLALIFFLAVMLAFVAIAHHEYDNNNAFIAAMVATGALIPTTVTEISTLAAYIIPQACYVPKAPFGASACFGTPLASPWIVWVHNLALLIGVVAGLIAWTFWGFFYRHLAGPSRQNAPIYAQLRQRYIALGSAVASAQPPATEAARAAHTTIDQVMKIVEDELGLDPERGKKLGQITDRRGRPGLRWVLATGYLSLWKLLHNAEEALLLVVSPPEILRRALHDLERLQGARVPHATSLQGTLRKALSVLSPTSYWYTNETPAGTGPPSSVGLMPVGRQPGLLYSWDPYAQTWITVGPGVWPPDSPPAAGSGAFASPPEGPDEASSGAEMAESDARAAVCEVRRALNEFQDSRWDSLVRRRNHLLEAVVFTRVTAFGVLSLAILASVGQAQILAVTVFYLVGALVGLFNRLSSMSSSSQTVEDYGLSSAILTQTTPFSGVAAVGGVLIVGLVGGFAQPGAGTAIVSNLASIFDLGKDQLGIIIAAIFGLTPSLLLRQLDQISEKNKFDLQSVTTSASTSTTATPS